MSCKKCNEQSNLIPGCGCPTPCNDPIACGCKIKINSECVTNTVDLTCSGVEKGLTLDKTLEGLDSYLCSLLGLIQNVSNGFIMQNVGDRVPVFKGISGTGVREFRTLESVDQNTLTITQDGDVLKFEVKVDIPSLNEDIPRYIVNNTYTGQEELGTVSKPFKTIQKAIDKFLGESGTIDAPENQGAFIIIQKGTVYTFTGNFSFRNLNLVIEEGAVILHQPAVGDWLVDLDILTEQKSETTIEIRNQARIVMFQKGFRNRGSLMGAPQAKRISISGRGTLELRGELIPGYVMFEANYNNLSGYAMPARQNMEVEGVRLYSFKKDIWNIGRDAELRFKNCLIRHSDTQTVIDPQSRAFKQKGGNINTTNCEYSINGVEREVLFSLKKNSDFACNLSLINSTLVFPQRIEYFFENVGSLQAKLECVGFSSEPLLSSNIVQIFKSDILWNDVNFKNNILPGGGIDETQVDLTANNTRSVSNWIGSNYIESLRRFPTRTVAENSIPLGAKFINTSNNNVDRDKWYIDIAMQ